MWLGALVFSLGIGVAIVASIAYFSGGNDTEAASGAPSVRKSIKVVITGTESAGEEVIDGGIAGLGIFRATGAITDHGTDTTYRKLTGPNDSIILLRFVTKGKKGTISYAVKIDTARRPVIPRWRIWSATGAYEGLQGRGDESENATYTVSTLTGSVWR